MAKKPIWISFDLGVRGDYEGIYQFLDGHAAKECGDSLAFLHFEFKNDLFADLKKDLKGSVKTDKRTRIYVIFPEENGRHKGRFLVGGRKRPPWTGYATSDQTEEDVGE